jgi:hypothetical protein
MVYTREYQRKFLYAIICFHGPKRWLYMRSRGRAIGAGGERRVRWVAGLLARRERRRQIDMFASLLLGCLLLAEHVGPQGCAVAILSKPLPRERSPRVGSFARAGR